MNQSNYQRLDGQAQAGEEEKFFDVLKAMKGHLTHTALILAGAMNRQRAEQMIAEGLIDLVGIGVDFISNPDLVARIKGNLPIAPADPASFHGGGAQGYIDYPPYR